MFVSSVLKLLVNGLFSLPTKDSSNQINTEPYIGY